MHCWNIAKGNVVRMHCFSLRGKERRCVGIICYGVSGNFRVADYTPRASYFASRNHVGVARAEIGGETAF